MHLFQIMEIVSILEHLIRPAIRDLASRQCTTNGIMPFAVRAEGVGNSTILLLQKSE